LNRNLRWTLINLLLPLSPFALRVFLGLVGPLGNISLSAIAELPELLFYSVFVCVSVLNVNLDGLRNTFESMVRIFLLALLVLDFVTLGLIYSGNLGPHVWKFTLFAAGFPAIIAPLYRMAYINKEE
jgi:predicted tellurium resistance membrane protein TerC